MRAPDFWQRNDASSRLLSALLSPLAALYAAGGRHFAAKAKPYRAHARVICVGNLTAGGTGKTPVAIAIGRMLTAKGCKVYFLTRGYGGQTTGQVVVDTNLHNAGAVGDEALLLARVAPTIVSRDRIQGAEIADSLGADVIVMDDGHQNFDLVKDVSLVVVDAETGFGNGRVIPAGPLREPIEQGLARTDAIVLVGSGNPKIPPHQIPVINAHIMPADPDALRGKMLFAFAGIGRPEKFFATLKTMGAKIAGTKAFADHHMFSAEELSELRTTANAKNAMLVTTEKDWVRLAASERQDILTVPIHIAFDEPAHISAILEGLKT